MSTTLVEARAILTDNVLHVDSREFTNAKLDRAIQYAGRKFCRETNCDVVLKEVTITSGVPDINITHFVPEFDISQFIRARINNFAVDKVPFKSVRRRYEGDRAKTGRPYWIGFDTPRFAKLFPSPDAGYTMTISVRGPFVAFKPGTTAPAAIRMNVPDEFISTMIEGAAGFLIGGAPGHPEWQSKNQMFEAGIAEAKEKFASGESGLKDTQTAA